MINNLDHDFSQILSPLLVQEEMIEKNKTKKQTGYSEESVMQAEITSLEENKT